MTYTPVPPPLPAKASMSKAKTAGVVVMGLALLIGVSAIIEPSSEKKAPATPTAPANVAAPSEAVPVPETLDSEWDGPVSAWVQEYESNEIAADAKYKGHRIKVTGRVRSVAKTVWGDAYVSIGDPMAGAQCFFARDREQSLASLRSGQNVAVVGTVTGRHMLNVTLEHCVIR